MADETPVESKVVTAVAISVNSVHGENVSQRLERAMAAEVLACNADGISTAHENAIVIRERMKAAHDRELELIRAEQDA